MRASIAAPRARWPTAYCGIARGMMDACQLGNRRDAEQIPELGAQHVHQRGVVACGQVGPERAPHERIDTIKAQVYGIPLVRPCEPPDETCCTSVGTANPSHHDEAYQDYLTGMAALRKRVVGDVKRKLDDSEILNRPHLEQSSPPERPAAAARHRRARGHRPRG